MSDDPFFRPSECKPGGNEWVALVADHCDRIIWRGRYYHLPLKNAAPQGHVSPDSDCHAASASQPTPSVGEVRECRLSGQAEYPAAAAPSAASESAITPPDPCPDTNESCIEGCDPTYCARIGRTPSAARFALDTPRTNAAIEEANDPKADRLTHYMNMTATLNQLCRQLEQELSARSSDALKAEQASYRIGYVDGATGKTPQVPLTEGEKAVLGTRPSSVQSSGGVALDLQVRLLRASEQAEREAGTPGLYPQLMREAVEALKSSALPAAGVAFDEPERIEGTLLGCSPGTMGGPYAIDGPFIRAADYDRLKALFARSATGEMERGGRNG